MTPFFQQSAAPGDGLAREDTHRRAPSFLPKEHPMTEELTSAIRVVEAAGYRVIRKSKFRPSHTREQIAFVLRRRGEGRSDGAIAAEMGVTRSTVSGIIWRHLTSKGKA